MNNPHYELGKSYISNKIIDFIEELEDITFPEDKRAEEHNELMEMSAEALITELGNLFELVYLK